MVLSSDDEEEWVPPTVAASSGAVRRVHQGRSQAVDDVRVVSQVEEMSTAEVFPMTDDAVVPRMPRTVGSGSTEPRWHTSFHSR